MTDITEIKRELNSRVVSVCEHLLPGGHRSGGEYETANTGGGKGSSLKVRLSGDKIGVWADFASGESGDLIDLWQAVRGVTRMDAMREACVWMGSELKFSRAAGDRSWRRPAAEGEAPGPESAVAKYLTRQRPGRGDFPFPARWRTGPAEVSGR